MEDLLAGLRTSWHLSLPRFQDFILYMLAAFVLSQALAFVYVRTHRGMSYSRSTVHALVLLSLIVTIVMMAIGDSLARAFGLFGALALIRFRTPIKDTRDTVFLFLAVGVGISVGTQNLLLAVTGTAFALAVAIYLHVSGFGDRLGSDGVLRLRLPSNEARGGTLDRILRRYCHSSSLLQIRDGFAEGEVELAYQLAVAEPELTVDLVADLRALPGASDVSLLMQTEQEEL